MNSHTDPSGRCKRADARHVEAISQKILEPAPFGDVAADPEEADVEPVEVAERRIARTEVDFLKIDKSFVQSIATDAGNGALCEAIVVMAHKLGLRVIAEGVETQEQADRLMRAGSDFAQGYLYSRPIPPEQLEAILRHGAHGR